MYNECTFMYFSPCKVLEGQAHRIRILAVGIYKRRVHLCLSNEMAKRTVFLFYLLYSKPKGVLIQCEGCSVGLSHMERDVRGTVYRRHRFFCKQPEDSVNKLHERWDPHARDWIISLFASPSLR